MDYFLTLPYAIIYLRWEITNDFSAESSRYRDHMTLKGSRDVIVKMSLNQ